MEYKPSSTPHLLLWTVAALFLALPLVAMQFTEEVRWSAYDFAAATIILVGTGASIEFAGRMFTRPVSKAVGITLAIGSGALIWADGAVGVF